jgi:hypothetical protein
MKQTSKIVKQKTTVEKKDRRAGRGLVIALSRHVYRLQGKDTFYVESESCDSRYYFVRFNSSFAGGFCGCKDFESNRTERCKHQYAVEYGIRFNTIQVVEHFPQEARKGLSYQDDEYSF